MSTTTHTPQWEILEGGNFVCVGEVGFTEWSQKHGYLGGPLSVCKLEHNATEDHEPDHAKAMERARLIAAAPDLLAALKCARAGLSNLIEFHILPSQYREDAKHELEIMDSAIRRAREGK
jgi:hypothetical protein